MRILDWKVVQLGSNMVSLTVYSNVQYMRWQSRRQDAARTNGSAWKDDRMGGGAGQGDKSDDGQAFVSFRLPRVMAACHGPHPTLPCHQSSIAFGKQVAYRSHTFLLDHLRQSILYQSPNHPITPSDQPNTPKHHHNARRKLLRKDPSTNPPTNPPTHTPQKLTPSTPTGPLPQGHQLQHGLLPLHPHAPRLQVMVRFWPQGLERRRVRPRQRLLRPSHPRVGQRGELQEGFGFRGRRCRHGRCQELFRQGSYLFEWKGCWQFVGWKKRMIWG